MYNWEIQINGETWHIQATQARTAVWKAIDASLNNLKISEESRKHRRKSLNRLRPSIVDGWALDIRIKRIE